jgi:hypothetical protein
MPSKKEAIKLFFEREPRQKWLLIAYCAFIVLFFILRILRNNQEFLFFSGVIAALYYFYNNELFKFNILKYVYLSIDVLLCFVFIAIGKESLSILFPLTTYIFLFIGRYIFIGAFKREPRIDILLQRNTDKFYTLILMLCIISSWIALLIKFMDKHIV